MSTLSDARSESGTTVEMLRGRAAVITPKLIFGPFYYVLRFSTFDMSPSVIGSDRALPIRVVVILLAVIINLLMIIRFFILAFSNSEVPLREEWAKDNLMAFQVLFGFISSMALIEWTKKNFLENFCERIMHCREMRLTDIPPPDRRAQRIFFYSLLFMILAIWSTVTVSDIVMYYKYVIRQFHQQNIFDMIIIFGVDPVVYTFASLASVLALLIYVTYNMIAAYEFEIFNKELDDESKKGKLINLQTLSNFNARHFELIQFLQFSNVEFQRLLSGGILSVGISSANAIFWSGGFYDTISTLNRIVAIIWGVVLIVMANLMLNPPCTVQTNIKETRRILRSDKSLLGLNDKEVRFHYKEIIARSKEDTCLRAIESIKILPWIQGIYFLIVPNIGTILAIIRRVIDNK